MIELLSLKVTITLLHSERPKLYAILAFLSAIGLKMSPSILFQHEYLGRLRLKCAEHIETVKGMKACC